MDISRISTMFKYFSDKTPPFYGYLESGMNKSTPVIQDEFPNKRAVARRDLLTMLWGSSPQLVVVVYFFPISRKPLMYRIA
jgi:hypothetical protein